MTRDLYTRFCSSLLFPLHERLKGHDTTRRLRALEDSQWLTRDAIQAAQHERLGNFLGSITRDIPYYRTLADRLGISAERMQAAGVLQRFPLLEKSDIRQHSEQMKRRGASLAKFNTGGSSGVPLIFWLGERVSHDVAAKWRATRWWDVDIGDRELVLWGSPVELKTQDRVKQIRDRLLRTELVPAFDLSPDGMRRFIHRFRQFRPRMLFGYPSAFARIAAFAEAEGLSLQSETLRVVFVTAERLYPEQRERIQSAFGVPVANGYGARDAGFLAHECPHGGMHIMSEDVVLETVDSEGHPTAPGVAGEIVVTHLATSDFPFVRYRTGDVGKLGDERCPCGRGLPLLSEIQGRTTDFVTACDGTVMHGLAVIYVVREIDGVESFRIIQHSREQLEVLVVSALWNDEKQARVVRGMRQRLGDALQVDVRVVQDIPREANGKFRYVISKISS